MTAPSLNLPSPNSAFIPFSFHPKPLSSPSNTANYLEDWKKHLQTSFIKLQDPRFPQRTFFLLPSSSTPPLLLAEQQGEEWTFYPKHFPDSLLTRLSQESKMSPATALLSLPSITPQSKSPSSLENSLLFVDEKIETDPFFLLLTECYKTFLITDVYQNKPGMLLYRLASNPSIWRLSNGQEEWDCPCHSLHIPFYPAMTYLAYHSEKSIYLLARYKGIQTNLFAFESIEEPSISFFLPRNDSLPLALRVLPVFPNQISTIQRYFPHQPVHISSIENV